MSHLCAREREVSGHTEAESKEWDLRQSQATSFKNPGSVTHLQQPGLTSWSFSNLSQQYYQLWTKYAHTRVCGGHHTHKAHHWAGAKCPCATGKCQHKKAGVAEKKSGRLGAGSKYKVTHGPGYHVARIHLVTEPAVCQDAQQENPSLKTPQSKDGEKVFSRYSRLHLSGGIKLIPLSSWVESFWKHFSFREVDREACGVASYTFRVEWGGAEDRAGDWSPERIRSLPSAASLRTPGIGEAGRIWGGRTTHIINRGQTSHVPRDFHRFFDFCKITLMQPSSLGLPQGQHEAWRTKPSWV